MKNNDGMSHLYHPITKNAAACVKIPRNCDGNTFARGIVISILGGIIPCNFRHVNCCPFPSPPAYYSYLPYPNP